MRRHLHIVGAIFVVFMTAWSLPTSATCRSNRDLFELINTNVKPASDLVRVKNIEGGSQEKVLVRDDRGQLWLLKADAEASELQTSAEVITAQIYRRLGYNVPIAHITYFERRRWAAIKWLGEELPLDRFLNDINSSKFRRLRVHAAYLKDWDRLRNDHNIKLGDDFGMLDFGGTLGSRAQGHPKPGDKISAAIGAFEATKVAYEIYSDFDVSWISDMHAWRNLTPADARAAAKDLKRLDDAFLKRVVDNAKYSSRKDANYMLRALKLRRDGLIEGIAAAVSQDAAPKIEVGVLQPDQVPDPSSARVWPASTPPTRPVPQYVETSDSYPIDQKVRDLKAAWRVESYLASRKMIGDNAGLMAQSSRVEDLSNRLIARYLNEKTYDRSGEEGIQELRYYADAGWHIKLNTALRNDQLVLRNGRLSSGKDLPGESLAEMANGLMVVAEHSPKHGAQTLYRGEVRQAGAISAKVGSVITLKEFLSTSIDPAVAREFMTPDTEHPDFKPTNLSVFIEIRLSDESTARSIFVPGLLWEYNMRKSWAMPLSPNILREEEMLFMPGTQFKIESAELKRDRSGKPYLKQIWRAL